MAYVGWQGFKSLAGKRSRLGSCCEKGCAAQTPVSGKDSKGERLVFIPVEMLSRPRRKS